MEVVNAKVVIDATGDGDVAFCCGAEYEMGNEELGLIQPATMFFRISNVDTDKVEADIQANLHNFYRKDGVNYRSFHWRVAEARQNGDWNLDRVSIGLFRMPKRNEWCVNTSRIINQIDVVIDFLRKYIPGYENCMLKTTADTLVVRETYHGRICNV